MNPPTRFLGALRPFGHPRVVTMLFLGFSAGVPILLIFSSLSLWLGEAGVEKSAVTYFSWAALGYSFKFVWAPLVDRLPLPVLSATLGRRRGWMLLSQLAVAGSILWMASIDPAAGLFASAASGSGADVATAALTAMAFAAVALGFSSATQDIVIDAYRIDSAGPELQAMMSSAYIAGYRVGMIVAGAGALYLAQLLGSTTEAYDYEAWRWTYVAMAAVMGVGMVTTLAIPEPGGRSAEEGMSGARTPGVADESVDAAAGIEAGAGAGGWAGGRAGAGSTASARAEPVVGKGPDETIAGNAADRPLGENLRFFAAFLIGVASFVLAYRAAGDPTFGAPAETLRMALVAASGNEAFAGLLAAALRLAVSLAAAAVVFRLLIAVRLVEASSVREAYLSPVADFFARYGPSVAWLLLALVGMYRVSDIVLGVISNVFYQDMGYTKAEIASVTKVFGLLMTIAGGFLGGLLAVRFGVLRILLLGAVLASGTNLLFVALASGEPTLGMLAVVIGADNLAAGLASAAFIAFLSSLTNVSFTAVQYAIFSSLMTLFPKVLGGYSGSIVESVGYPAFFVLTALLTVPVIALIVLARRHLDREVAFAPPSLRAS